MLSDFGFTANQAKVYMAAVALGLASAGQIAKSSKVRREEVYRVLPKLEKMGLIEKRMGKPVRISAAPLNQSLSLLIKHEQESGRQRVLGLQAKKRTILEHVKMRRKPELESEEVSFALLSRREGITDKLQSMIGKAGKEIDLVCSKAGLMQLTHVFAEQVKRMTRKGVKVRLIVGMSENDITVPKIMEEYILCSASVSLRYTQEPSSHYLIVDSEQAVVATTMEGSMTENPCLWTCSKNLIGVLQASFENLWRTSAQWSPFGAAAVGARVTRFTEQLEPTDHVIFVYDSAESKRRVLFNYLKKGLTRGEAALYLVADESPEELKQTMRRSGVSVGKYEEDSALRVASFEDFETSSGTFDSAKALQMTKEAYDSAVKNGLRGVRSVEEMSWFFKHDRLDDLLEYEKALHRTLDIPVITICAYNSNSFKESGDPIGLYTKLVEAHGTVLFTAADNGLGRIELRRR